MTRPDDRSTYSAAFEISPVGLAISDEEGRYIDANPTYCRMFGYRREELLGQTFGVILVLEQKSWEPGILAMALENDALAPTQWQVQARDGRRLTVRSSFRCQHLEGGHVRIVTALVDITELQATIAGLQASEDRLQLLNSRLESMVAARTVLLEASNRQLSRTVAALETTRRVLEERERAHRLMIETAHDAALSIDAQGHVLVWNQAAETMFGWTREQALGRHIGHLIVPENQRDKHALALASFFSRQSSKIINHTMELLAQHQDKHCFPVECSIWAHHSNGQPVFSAFLRDITDRKRLENESLEALRQTHELLSMKSRFVAMASHEFKTPLTVIKSSAELLAHCDGGLAPQDRLRLVSNIRSGSQRMCDLLDEVLIFERTDGQGRRNFNPAPLDIFAWCQELVGELTRAGLGGERIRLHFEGCREPRLLDERLLRQAVTNLLTNALKYSASTSPVEFQVCLAQDLRIEISDHGIGIPQEEQARLFDSFFRASNVGQVPGTGLGLLIAQKSVLLHGGQLHFSSQAGQGSRFGFVVPAQ